MVIDFKEISAANVGGVGQDHFEQFACDFLETIGYEIERRPDRGPDGKKDLIVIESRIGISGKTTIRWLVSCKHYAHRNKAVNDMDEPDIRDRVEKHNCDGFLGFYSTLMAPTLSDKLYSYRDKMEHTVYDSGRIEKELLSIKDKERLLVSFFPNSYAKYREHKNSMVGNEFSKHSPKILTEDDVLRVTQTAIILLEIEKIKEEYYNNGWENRDAAISKLYRFSDYSNGKVASAILVFLDSVTHHLRLTKSSAIASSVHSLILTFFPSSYESSEEEIRANGIQCIYIASGMIYDAFIHSRNFSISGEGFLILKYLYRYGKLNNDSNLTEKVLEQYEELRQNLNRPERNDLNEAKQLLDLFEKDLDKSGLAYPIMPENLFKLLQDDRGK